MADAKTCDSCDKVCHDDDGYNYAVRHRIWLGIDCGWHWRRIGLCYECFKGLSKIANGSPAAQWGGDRG